MNEIFAANLQINGLDNEWMNEWMTLKSEEEEEEERTEQVKAAPEVQGGGQSDTDTPSLLPPLPVFLLLFIPSPMPLSAPQPTNALTPFI